MWLPIGQAIHTQNWTHLQSSRPMECICQCTTTQTMWPSVFSWECICQCTTTQTMWPSVFSWGMLQPLISRTEQKIQRYSTFLQTHTKDTTLFYLSSNSHKRYNAILPFFKLTQKIQRYSTFLQTHTKDTTLFYLSSNSHKRYNAILPFFKLTQKHSSYFVHHLPYSETNSPRGWELTW